MDSQTLMPTTGCQNKDATTWMRTHGCVDVETMTFRKKNTVGCFVMTRADR